MRIKHSTVQAGCGLALALMTGAVAAHWTGVRQTVKLAQMLKQPAPRMALPAAPPEDDPVVRKASQALAAVQPEIHPAAPVVVTNAGMSAEQSGQISDLITSCKALLTQNQELKSQLAETNRDVMALQFQVDSHSASFRPLRIAEDPEDAVPSGVLPPKQAP